MKTPEPSLLNFANSEMDKFMSNLDDEILIDYSEDLMILADNIIGDNPQSMKGLLC